MSPERRKWSYSDTGKQFHAAHAYIPYTMAFNSLLETGMCDEGLNSETRVFLGLLRDSWGYFSDEAVNAYPPLGPNDPKPVKHTQAGFGRSTGLKESTISGVLKKLRARGYVPKDALGLIDQQDVDHSARVSAPAGKAALHGVRSHSSRQRTPGVDSDSTDYKRAEARYLAENPEEAAKLAYHLEERERHKAMARTHAAEIDRIRDRARDYYRDWDRRQKRTKNEDKANGPSPANGSGSVEPPGAEVRTQPEPPPPPLQPPPKEPEAFVLPECQGGGGSDSEDENSTLLEGELRTPGGKVRTPQRVEPPNPPLINEEPDRPLKPLMTEGSPFEGRAGSVVEKQVVRPPVLSSTSLRQQQISDGMADLGYPIDLGLAAMIDYNLEGTPVAEFLAHERGETEACRRKRKDFEVRWLPSNARIAAERYAAAIRARERAGQQPPAEPELEPISADLDLVTLDKEYQILRSNEIDSCITAQPDTYQSLLKEKLVATQQRHKNLPPAAINAIAVRDVRNQIATAAGVPSFEEFCEGRRTEWALGKSGGAPESDGAG